MSYEKEEYRVAQRIVKADKRLRTIRYALTALIFFFFILIGVELHFTRQDIAKALQEIKTQNEETRRYTTCLLLVPIEKRTPEVQKECFRLGDAPGGLDVDDFTPASSDGSANQSSAVPNQPSQNSQESSVPFPNNTPTPEQKQSDTSQNPPAEPQPSLVEQVLQPVTNLVERIL
jgi:hypothetical protein